MVLESPLLEELQCSTGSVMDGFFAFIGLNHTNER